MMTAAETDENAQPEVIAFAAAMKTGELYQYRGDDTTEYPVKFDGVTCDGALTIDSQANLITSQLVGTLYYSAEFDSEEGRLMRDLAKRLGRTDGTDELLEVLDNEIEGFEDGGSER
jgi:hypothetical protein